MRSDSIKIDISIPNHTRYLGMIGKIGEDVARAIKSYPGDREELAYHINLVLTEAMSNAIHHANEGDPDKKLRVSIQIDQGVLSIQVHDQGRGFNSDQFPDPELKHLEEHGRGIYIIRSLMDEVTYQKVSTGHVLEMTKTLY
ncbi:MAG: anti-sigma factor [Desulfuromonas sp.]|nr:MAG: anti-sigma factor [Desulfuromonas sp.]